LEKINANQEKITSILLKMKNGGNGPTQLWKQVSQWLP
jgi:hypothetical protein